MIFFFIFFTINLLFFDLYPQLLDHSQDLHGVCRDLIKSPTWPGLQSAFLCGTPLEQRSEIYKTFRITGLLHLIVVSGSHLGFIQNLVNPIFSKGSLRAGALMISFATYAAVCLWDPPITRAAIFFAVHLLNHKLKLNFSPVKRVHFTGLICLILFPHWVNSYSLLLSWLAALALSCGRGVIQHCVLCYFALCPILTLFNGVHPLTILINIFVGPLFGFLLLPITLIANLWPLWEPINSFCWVAVTTVLENLEFHIPELPKKNGPKGSVLFMWCYLFTVQLGLWTLQTITKMKKIL